MAAVVRWYVVTFCKGKHTRIRPAEASVLCTAGRSRKHSQALLQAKSRSGLAPDLNGLAQ